MIVCNNVARIFHHPLVIVTMEHLAECISSCNMAYYLTEPYVTIYFLRSVLNETFVFLRSPTHFFNL